MDGLVRFCSEEIALEGEAGCTLDFVWASCKKYFAKQRESAGFLFDLADGQIDNPVFREFLYQDIRTQKEIEFVDTDGNLLFESEHPIDLVNFSTNVRLRASEDLRWYTITGQRRDESKMSNTMFAVLATVAKGRTQGVTSVRVAKENNIDPRNLYNPVSKLLQLGLISKIVGVICEKSSTSLLVHKRYIHERIATASVSGIETSREVINVKELRASIMKYLETSPNEALTYNELRNKLGINSSRFYVRNLANQVRKLGDLGYVRRFRVISKPPKTGFIHCLKMLAPYDAAVDAAIDDDQVIIKDEDNFESDPERLDLDDEDDGDRDEVSYKDKGIQREYTVEWSVYDAVERLGTNGATGKQIIIALNANDARRVITQALERLSSSECLWPEHLRHLKLYKLADSDGRTHQYRYFTLKCMLKLQIQWGISMIEIQQLSAIGNFSDLVISSKQRIRRLDTTSNGNKTFSIPVKVENRGRKPKDLNSPYMRRKRELQAAMQSDRDPERMKESNQSNANVFQDSKRKHDEQSKNNRKFTKKSGEEVSGPERRRLRPSTVRQESPKNEQIVTPEFPLEKSVQRQAVTSLAQLSRQDALLKLLEEANGVVDSSNPALRATLSQRLGGLRKPKGQMDRRTLRSVIDTLKIAGKLKEYTFSFPMGIRTILALPSITENSHSLKSLREALKSETLISKVAITRGGEVENIAMQLPQDEIENVLPNTERAKPTAQERLSQQRIRKFIAKQTWISKFPSKVVEEVLGSAPSVTFSKSDPYVCKKREVTTKEDKGAPNTNLSLNINNFRRRFQISAVKTSCWQDEYVSTNTYAGRRDLLLSQSFTVSKKKTQQQPVPEEIDIERRIKSIINSSSDVYTAEKGKSLWEGISKSQIAKVAERLIQQKTIVRIKTESDRLLPGRNYIFRERALNVLKTGFPESLLSESTQFYQKLETSLKKKNFVEILPETTGGAVNCIMKLLIRGEVTIEPLLGIKVNRLKGGYRTRALDKSTLQMNLCVRPENQFGRNRSLYTDFQVDPPDPIKPCLWVDVDGNVITSFWDRLVQAVFLYIKQKPAVLKEKVGEHLGIIVNEHELSLILEQLIVFGMVEMDKEGGLCTLR